MPFWWRSKRPYSVNGGIGGNNDGPATTLPFLSPLRLLLGVTTLKRGGEQRGGMDSEPWGWRVGVVFVALMGVFALGSLVLAASAEKTSGLGRFCDLGGRKGSVSWYFGCADGKGKGAICFLSQSPRSESLGLSSSRVSDKQALALPFSPSGRTPRCFHPALGLPPSPSPRRRHISFTQTSQSAPVFHNPFSASLSTLQSIICPFLPWAQYCKRYLASEKEPMADKEQEMDLRLWLTGRKRDCVDWLTHTQGQEHARCQSTGVKMWRELCEGGEEDGKWGNGAEENGDSIMHDHDDDDGGNKNEL